jgi:indole-3-glycerol phosphate synthase
MSNILDRIAAHKRLEVEQLKFDLPFDRLRRSLERAPGAGHRFKGALTGEKPVRIIAELKQGSPSKGLIRRDFDVAATARAYRDGGAVALSVLTDRKYFYGGFDNLRQAGEAAPDLPCLCKDFVLDPYQLYYARHRGAAAVLLIVKLLTPQKLTEMMGYARELGMDCLVEVHDEGEGRIAVDAGAEIVGVNSRDLRNFDVDLSTAERVAGVLSGEVVKVAESGISTAADIARLRQAGYECFLIGEALMRSDQPEKLLRELQAL